MPWKGESIGLSGPLLPFEPEKNGMEAYKPEWPSLGDIFNMSFLSIWGGAKMIINDCMGF